MKATLRHQKTVKTKSQASKHNETKANANKKRHTTTKISILLKPVFTNDLALPKIDVKRIFLDKPGTSESRP